MHCLSYRGLTKMAACMVQNDSLEENFRKRIADLSKECNTLQKENLDLSEQQLLLKASSKCHRCLKTLEKSKHKLTEQSWYSILREYAQAVMDQTYILECRLVNEEFPDNSYKDRLSNILDQLRHPEEFAAMLVDSNESQTKTIEALGVEVLECLHWRRGALMYMLCHTIYEDQERLKHNTATFVKDCEKGVRFLMLMLSIRTPLSEKSSSLEIRDCDTAALLRQGIFSDTHMLAFMYAGELCCWHWRTVRTHSHMSTRDLSTIGLQCLSKYTETCEGALNGKGWDCTKAKTLIAEMENSLNTTDQHYHNTDQ
ncbi:RAB7A-interacting MON1-CCZ1 complex subunit 1 isoform X3 [Nematostella vectensis]|uniref:RAB7A-interacting MON1-CCZ1 complex subunit 1 isoform X3 n=1 Tax=Nematostella vectensis TaxID=45351 RepID=UPI00207757A5|nr:RAB7A-interacting MON1-CCZ1 complex subunit 1 isoform X3 [Nematostella vectensis]